MYLPTDSVVSVILLVGFRLLSSGVLLSSYQYGLNSTSPEGSLKFIRIQRVLFLQG